MASNAPGGQPVFSKRYRTWLLTMLILIYAMNLADRQGMAAIAQAIKVDLRITDAQMGIIQGLGFAIFYTLLGLPLARMAERWSRTKIIAGCLAVFGAMVCLCSTATSFLKLLAFRVGVGIGDAGFGPPVASLVGDHYSMRKRASAMSVIWLGAPLGVVFGSVLGGWMAQHVSWRAAFIAIGAPGLVIALVAFLTLREPPRGLADNTVESMSGPPPSTWAVLRFLFAKRSMRHVLVGCGVAAMSMNAIGQFLGQFLVRDYHIGYAEAGRLLAIIAGAAMASGLLLGGFGVDWASRFDKRWFVWGPAVGLLLAAPAFVLGFSQTSVAGAVVVLMAAHVLMFVYYTPTLAMAQNMVAANMRASSAFMVSLVLGLVGIGLGPTVLGLLSDGFARHVFTLGSFATMCPGGVPPAGAAAPLADACRAASATGIQYAMIAMSLVLVWASLHYLLAARTLRHDLEVRYEQEGSGLGAPAAGT